MRTPSLRSLARLTSPLLLFACSASSESAAPVNAAPQAADAAGSDPAVDPNAMSWLRPGVDPVAVAKREGLEVKAFDLDRDGKPDIFKFFKTAPDPQNPSTSTEHLVRKEIDLNHDGRIDIVRLYDAQQQVAEERADLDFDGKADEVSYYKDGALLRKDLFLTYDAKPDVVKYYAGGHLVRVERDRNHTGKVDTWEYYEEDVLQRVGIDNNGDGKVDEWERKDASAGADATKAPAGS